MDRRDFFKTIIASPLLAPFVLGSSSPPDSELYLISSSPETILPSLLEDLQNQRVIHGKSFALSDSHPRKTAIALALKASGWMNTPVNHPADLVLSFRSLNRPLPASFTLVRSGKIVDIRTNGLYSTWREIQERHPSSSCMTIATLKKSRISRSPGTVVRIYHNGHVAEELSLKKDQTRNFRTDQGAVSVKINNGRVSVPASSCRHKICCSVPPVFHAADRIVCAPNHFLLEVRGPGNIDTLIG
jgi:hypothetical protein